MPFAKLLKIHARGLAGFVGIALRLERITGERRAIAMRGPKALLKKLEGEIGWA